jgi:hypothetical protein
VKPPPELCHVGLSSLCISPILVLVVVGDALIALLLINPNYGGAVLGSRQEPAQEVPVASAPDAFPFSGFLDSGTGTRLSRFNSINISVDVRTTPWLIQSDLGFAGSYGII